MVINMNLKLASSVILPTLLALSGCNGHSSHNNNANNSNTSPSKEVVKPTEELKPKADYPFSQAESQELLNERLEVINSSSLTFAGHTYSLKYATGDDEILTMWENKNHERLSLLIPGEPEANSMCEMDSGKNYYFFDCSAKQLSENDDLLTLNGKYLGKADVNQQDGADFILEFTPYIGMIGTTELAIAKGTNNQATITTRNPFANNLNMKVDSTDLGVTTYLQMQNSLSQLAGYDITFVVDSKIDGSSDDDINMYTGLLIRDNKLDTRITTKGSVFSGGTDLFAAGVNRILERRDPNVAIEKNEQIGVHSWAGEDDSGKEVEATQVPYTNEQHRKQATYFEKMLKETGIDFYLYTIKSAPAKGGHYMTRAEMDKYNFVTEFK